MANTYQEFNNRSKDARQIGWYKGYKRDKTNLKYQCLYIWQRFARIRILTSMELSGKMANTYQKFNHRSHNTRQIDWHKGLQEGQN